MNPPKLTERMRRNAGEAIRNRTSAAQFAMDNGITVDQARQILRACCCEMIRDERTNTAIFHHGDRTCRMVKDGVTTTFGNVREMEECGLLLLRCARIARGSGEE